MSRLFEYGSRPIAGVCGTGARAFFLDPARAIISGPKNTPLLFRTTDSRNASIFTDRERVAVYIFRRNLYP
jgi:hypothetical protein